MIVTHILFPLGIIIVTALVIFKVVDFLEDRQDFNRCRIRSIHCASLWEFGFGYLLE